MKPVWWGDLSIPSDCALRWRANIVANSSHRDLVFRQRPNGPRRLAPTGLSLRLNSRLRGGTKIFKPFRQFRARCRAAINPQAIMEGARLLRWQCPIGEAGDVWIDETLVIGTPGGWISRIGGMIEYGN